jgi:hypothetical protein
VGSLRRIELKKEELTNGCTETKNVQDETSDAKSRQPLARPAADQVSSMR